LPQSLELIQKIQTAPHDATPTVSCMLDSMIVGHHYQLPRRAISPDERFDEVVGLGLVDCVENVDALNIFIAKSPSRRTRRVENYAYLPGQIS
jgi:hypothetical protein